MSDVHPVLRQRGFTIKAPPLLEFVAEFSKMLNYGEQSLICYGPPRFGKSTASAYVRVRMDETHQAVVIRALIQKDPETRGRSSRLFRDLCQGQEEFLDPLIRNPYQTLVNRIRNSARRLNVLTVLIVIDESQNLNYIDYFALKKLVDELIDFELSPFVLMMAQSEILSQAERMKRRLVHDVVDRFLTRMYRYRGLRPDEFINVLQHYDTARWPEPTSPTYSEHFVPSLWRKGWRLEREAPVFIDAFSRLASEVGKDPSDFGMKYLTTAVRGLLNALAADDRLIGDVRSLIRRCVRDCGFFESARVVGDSELAARTYKPPSKIIRVIE